MKFIGALLLILVTTWMGFDWSRQLQRRTNELREIIHSLQMMEAEMGYTYAPLQIVFTNIRDKTNFPVREFYDDLATALTYTVDNLPAVWERALQTLVARSAMKEEERGVLLQFGKNIGNHTFEQQEKHIRLTIHHLQHTLAEANEEKHTYQRMAKTLGVLSGIFIVLLLF